jgi:hypothetical protein
LGFEVQPDEIMVLQGHTEAARLLSSTHSIRRFFVVKKESGILPKGEIKEI